jgi:hypothetical protein
MHWPWLPKGRFQCPQALGCVSRGFRAKKYRGRGPPAPPVACGLWPPSRAAELPPCTTQSFFSEKREEPPADCLPSKPSLTSGNREQVKRRVHAHARKLRRWPPPSSLFESLFLKQGGCSTERARGQGPRTTLTQYLIRFHLPLSDLCGFKPHSK